MAFFHFEHLRNTKSTSKPGDSDTVAASCCPAGIRGPSSEVPGRALTSLAVAEVARGRGRPARGQLCSVHHRGAFRNGPVHWHRFQNCCFKREEMSVLVVTHHLVYSGFKQRRSCNRPWDFGINSARIIPWMQLKEWESLVPITQKLINKGPGESQQVVNLKAFG